MRVSPAYRRRNRGTYHEDDHHFGYSLWHPVVHTLRSGRAEGASRFHSALVRLFLLGSVLAQVSPLKQHSLLQRYLQGPASQRVVTPNLGNVKRRSEFMAHAPFAVWQKSEQK